MYGSFKEASSPPNNLTFPLDIMHTIALQGTPDHPWSLYEGHAGLLNLYTDLVVNPNPSTARFPVFEMGVEGGASGAAAVGTEE